MLAFILQARAALTLPIFLALDVRRPSSPIRLVPGDPDRGAHAASAASRPSGLPSCATSWASTSRSGSSSATISGTSCMAISAPRSSRHEPVLTRVPDALSRPPWSSRSAAMLLRHRPRHSGRRDRRRCGAARVYRPDAHGAAAHRLLHADLLVGPAAHHARSPAARPDAGVGPHRPHQYYFEPVTGFMLIDSLLSGQEGAFRSRCATSSCRRSCSAPSRSR